MANGAPVKEKVEQISAGIVRDISENINFQTSESAGNAILLKVVFSALFGAFVSGAEISGAALPVGVAFASALPPVYAAAAMAGDVIGLLFTGLVTARAPDILALVMLCGIKIIASSLFRRDIPGQFSFLIGGVSYIISGFSIAAVSAVSLPLSIAVVFRGLVCATLAQCFFESFRIVNKKSPVISINPKTEYLILSAVFVTTVCAVSGIGISVINLGRCLSVAACLIACRQFGEKALIINALSLFGMLLCSHDLARGSLLLLVGTLSAVLFGSGKLSIAALFLIALLSGEILSGVPSGAINLCADAFCGALIYCLIPSRLTDYLKKITEVNFTEEYFSKKTENFAALINETSQAFDKAGEILNNRQKISKNNRIDINAVLTEEIESSRRKICAACSDSVFCPNFKTGFPQSAMMTFTRNLTLKGFLSESDISGSPTEYCTRRPALTNEINRRETYRRAKQNNAEFARNIRSAVSASLHSYEELLSAVTPKFLSDKTLTAKISSTLKEQNPGARFSLNAGFSNGLIYAEIFSDGEITVLNDKKTAEKFTEKISNIAGMKLRLSMHDTTGKNHRYIYAPKPPFFTEISVAQIPAKRGSVNGDTVREFSDGYGTDYVIISDGMGHGARARVESAMTASILSRLIKGGADPLAALKLTNILLRAKSDSEMLSTVDLLCYNRYESTVKLYKMGASVTFLMSGGEITEYRSKTLPLGILTEFEADIFEFSVKPHDTCIMLSDGILENIYPLIKEILLNDQIPQSKKADKILETAETYTQMDITPDDKTAVTIKFLK
ncbi:MAG: SpoIIE family protein phosphatase [Ruminococcus sp.]|jgi:stage II sporulation protein E|nr:SpoIIE family protein phosphatase [Ruminococcus sp.]